MNRVPSIGSLALITAALLLLLVATLAAAAVNLGALNTPVAMAISAAKATLIVLFFMGVRSASGLVRIFACAGFFWLALMMALTFSDYLTR